MLVCEVWTGMKYGRKSYTQVQFPNSVPVTTLLDRPSKFRRQVKQARLPTITAVALHYGVITTYSLQKVK